MKTRIVIPAFNQGVLLEQKISALAGGDDAVLVVNDGSTDDTLSVLENISGIISITHEQYLGFGSCVTTARDFCRDHGDAAMIFLDLKSVDPAVNIEPIRENLAYGYDFVSVSRILENYGHSAIPGAILESTAAMAAIVNEITGNDFTDPLTPIMGAGVEALDALELSEFGPGIMIQLWIQAAFFGYTVIEIPSLNREPLGSEFSVPEGDLEYLLALSETERHLYRKGTIN